MTVTTAPDIIEELRWRGLIHSITEGAEDVLKAGPVTAYIGFDPTADSLHVGSLLPIMVLVHLQRHGHTPIALVGGGTGMIGDPSGKSKERNLLDTETLERNKAGIHAQLESFLDFVGENPAIMVDNYDWLGELNLIAFLRDVAKHFTVNYMMAKDSVKSRLGSEEGISYTEFTYMLLQAYDFFELHERHGCTFQFGGSDQWGNITAGGELIRRMTENGKAHGVTVPLVTSSSGVKFGKTESGTVWLDPARTSPYRFYQFWINTPDDDVIRYLKFFTLLGPDVIAELETAMAENPGARAAQKRLAEEVTRSVHGEDALQAAIKATDVLFGGSLEGLSADDLMDIFSEVPSSTVSAGTLRGDGMPLVDIVIDAGFESSKKRARDLIGGGGVNVNNEKIEDIDAVLTLDHAIDGQVLVLRKGKKTYHIVRVE